MAWPKEACAIGDALVSIAIADGFAGRWQRRNRCINKTANFNKVTAPRLAFV